MSNRRHPCYSERTAHQETERSLRIEEDELTAELLFQSFTIAAIFVVLELKLCEPVAGEGSCLSPEQHRHLGNSFIAVAAQKDNGA